MLVKQYISQYKVLTYTCIYKIVSKVRPNRFNDQKFYYIVYIFSRTSCINVYMYLNICPMR